MIRYLFSVNTGRCGSYYLARLLSCAKGVHSFHEPEPTCQGEALIEWNRGNPGPMEREVEAKLRFIRENSCFGEIYSETSNAFVKGFGWELLKHLPAEEVGVIVLRRDIKATIESLDAASAWPSECSDAGFWLLRPDFPRNATKREHGETEWRWYIREVYTRGIAMQAAYPKVRFIESTLDEMNSMPDVLDVFATLGLDPDHDKLRQVVGIPLNTRSNPGDEQQSRHQPL